jgi:hypothetical protein
VTSPAFDPLARSARRFVVLATALVLVAAATSASVRLLPWVLDPRIRKETLAPFVRSLLVIGSEVALLTGWPVGWALAAQRLVDRGEARVLATLGESPVRTAWRLAPQGLAFAGMLALASFALGRTSAAPGQVVDALLRDGRAACAAAASPQSSSIPFVSATWLCGADRAPRLVGRSPIGGVVFTAAGARVSDDLRRIDLEDARVALGGAAGAGEGLTAVHVHVKTLTLRGLAPFTTASPLAPWARALLLVLAGAGSGTAAVLAVLRPRRGGRRKRSSLASPEGGHARVEGDEARGVGFVVAAALGAVGPTTALAALRAVELRLPDRADRAELGPWWTLALLAVPVVAVAAVQAVAALASAIGARLGR